MAADDNISRRKILRKSCLLLIAWNLFLGVIMFVPAGIHWTSGWLFLVVFSVYTVRSAWYLWRVNPDIFITRSKIHEGTKSWDKVLMVLLLASFLAIFVVAALAAPFGWSRSSTSVIVVGYVLFTLGFVVSIWCTPSTSSPNLWFGFNRTADT